MEQFSITTDTKAIHDILLKKILAEVGNEVAVDIEENSVILTSEDEKIKEKIVGAISKTIVEEYENRLISKLIKQNYFYFNLPDKKSIYKKALNYADNESSYNSLVSEKLKEYLETTDKSMLEGFVNFRLKDYQNELEDVIDKAVDDFMVEKEYKEFIKLLKYFVEIQKPKYELINIVPVDGEYYIYDDTAQDITAICAKEFIKDMDNERINSDDLLISSLISMAPKKICVHKPERIYNVELLSTIKQVFAKNITMCDGCELCNKFNT